LRSESDRMHFPAGQSMLERLGPVFRHRLNVLFDEETDPRFAPSQTRDSPLHPLGLAAGVSDAFVSTAWARRSGKDRFPHG
jgi:hypothetical protein